MSSPDRSYIRLLNNSGRLFCHSLRDWIGFLYPMAFWIRSLAVFVNQCLPFWAAASLVHLVLLLLFVNAGAGRTGTYQRPCLQYFRQYRRRSQRYRLPGHCQELGDSDGYWPQGDLEISGRQMAIAHHTCLAILSSPIHMLAQQGLQFGLKRLLDQALRARPQQFHQGASPASRPAGSITLFLLIVVYLPMVVLVLCNNKSTRYAASFQLIKHQI